MNFLPEPLSDEADDYMYICIMYMYICIDRSIEIERERGSHFLVESFPSLSKILCPPLYVCIMYIFILIDRSIEIERKRERKPFFGRKSDISHFKQRPDSYLPKGLCYLELTK